MPNEQISNFKNNPLIHQPLGPSHQSKVLPKNPQFESDNTISELKSDRIHKDPYQDQVSEASTNTSQNMNLKEEVSTETNPIEEPEPEIDTNLSKKEKRADELSEIYSLRVSFFSVLEASSFTLESSSYSELKSSLITSEYACLEACDTLSASIALNSTSNPKTQFMNILKEQIEKILNK